MYNYAIIYSTVLSVVVHVYGCRKRLQTVGESRAEEQKNGGYLDTARWKDWTKRMSANSIHYRKSATWEVVLYWAMDENHTGYGRREAHWGEQYGWISGWVVGNSDAGVPEGQWRSTNIYHNVPTIRHCHTHLTSFCMLHRRPPAECHTTAAPPECALWLMRCGTHFAVQWSVHMCSDNYICSPPVHIPLRLVEQECPHPCRAPQV